MSRRGFVQRAKDFLRTSGASNDSEQNKGSDVALFDPSWPELLEDPHPAFHRLRIADPIHWSAAMNGWLITRYGDAASVLRDERFSSDRDLWPKRPYVAARDDLGAFGRVKTTINADRPEQTRLRQPTTRLFSSALVEPRHARIQATVDEHSFH